MKIPTIKEVADFLKEATEGMLARAQDEVTYHLALTDRVAIVVAWEPGYDPEDSKDNKYIAKDGWGICWSLRLRDSSYFTSDWDYLGEMAGVTIYEGDEEDGFVSLAEEILEIADNCCYLHPAIWITLPDGREVNLLDDADYVQENYADRASDVLEEKIPFIPEEARADFIAGDWDMNASDDFNEALFFHWWDKHQDEYKED